MKRNTTTVFKIAEFIRQEITNCNFKSGQHISEAEISKKFNVSRVPVREAFRILQSEGYIEVIANRGSFVKIITNEYILETAIFNKLLAPVVLEKAIPNYKNQTYIKAAKVLKEVESCSDYSKVGYLLWDFAKIIYGPSKMKYILGLFDDVYSHNIRTLNELYLINQKKYYDTTNHRKFLELCSQNKKNEAIKLWKKHLVNVEQTMLLGRKKTVKELY